MSKACKDSLKVLQADIGHANTLALQFDMQIKVSIKSSAKYLLWLFPWRRYSFAAALGLIRVLIYKVYADGTTTTGTDVKKASLRDFYRFIYPALQQLRKVKVAPEQQQQQQQQKQRHRVVVDAESERDRECGICFKMESKVALPGCGHALCYSCLMDWHAMDKSCPFCRGSLEGVQDTDVWVLPDHSDVVDMLKLHTDSVQRLLTFVDKLPAKGSSSISCSSALLRLVCCCCSPQVDSEDGDETEELWYSCSSSLDSD